MKTKTSTIPILTRRLRVSFDLELNLLPVSPELLEQTPSLATFQQALQRSPELLDRLLALQALDSLYDYSGGARKSKEGFGQLPYSPFDVIQAALNQVTLSEALPFLFFVLTDMAGSIYGESLFLLRRTALASSLPVITDLDSSKILSYQECPASPILYQDPHDRYLVIEIAGERILVLNMIYFEDAQEELYHLDAIAADLSNLGLTILRVQVIVLAEGRDLSSKEKDDISVVCAETFPNLPVNVYVLHGQGNGDNSCAA